MPEFLLGRCPYKVMDSIQDRPWDTYGPNLSWSEFLYLRQDLNTVLEEIFDHRDQLIDRINTLNNILLKNGIEAPKWDLLESPSGTVAESRET